MVQLVHQLLSPNRHPQTPGVGEVRQPPSPRLVLLSENDLARRPVLRLPAPNPSLQRPPNPRMQFRMTPHHLFVQRHRPQPRVRLQQRHDLLVEYPRQRVGASPPPRLLHRPTPRIPFDPIRRRPAEPRLRRRQRRPVLPSSGHVQLHLVVRNPSARHFASLLIPGKHQSSNLPPPPPAVSPCLSQASHPDCRATPRPRINEDAKCRGSTREVTSKLLLAHHFHTFRTHYAKKVEVYGMISIESHLNHTAWRLDIKKRRCGLRRFNETHTMPAAKCLIGHPLRVLPIVGVFAGQGVNLRCSTLLFGRRLSNSVRLTHVTVAPPTFNRVSCFGVGLLVFVTVSLLAWNSRFPDAGSHVGYKILNLSTKIKKRSAWIPILCHPATHIAKRVLISQFFPSPVEATNPLEY